MRIVSTIFCIVLLLTATETTAGIFSTKVEMVVKIVDDNQVPVEGANVTGSFRQYPSNIEIKCITDKVGVCVIKGKTSNDGAIQVNKEGYYYSSMPFEFKEINKKLNRHEPWGATYLLVLKKKRNPIPMYARRIHSMKVPVVGSPIGYDLEAGDWVAPHGKGVKSDFIFLFNNEVRGKNDFTSSFELTFLNELDGIQELKFDEGENSMYRWPYAAPLEGYKPKLSKFISDEPHGNFQSNVSKDKNYIFRVRTRTDEKGNIIEARYGKILGDIQIGVKLLGFTYYYNPDGTPNLEFDPEQNLFKFNRREKRKHRVQRP